MSSAEALLPVDLDKVDSYLPLDSLGMAKMTMDFASQCREAISIAEAFSTGPELGKVGQVVVCGLGGSAIAGDLVERLTLDRISVPLYVNRQYELPAWVGERTLVVLSSYSGNTEETVSAFQQALSRRARVVCITSGGKLAQQAAQNAVPVIKIPGGRPPRAATGYLIFPLIAILEKTGLLPEMGEEKAEAVALLGELSVQFRPDSPTAENEAKQVARALVNHFGLIYGWGYLAPVARRWGTQLNENGKALAHWGELPEMNHNEVVPWAHRNPINEKLIAVLLRDKEEPPRLRARFELTKRIIAEHAPLRECWTRGRSRLARQMSLVYLGDFASIYLAFLTHRDPAEMNAIEFLKGELAKLN